MSQRIVCSGCGAAYKVSDKQQGKRLRCKKCETVMVVGADPGKQNAAGKRADAGDAGAKNAARGDRRNDALKAWKELEESRRDSYWVAVLKACIYPFQALGALIFFVVGTPVVFALVELIAKYALSAAGASQSLSQPDKLRYFAVGVVALGLLVVLAVLSFFCSFLFSVIRTSSEGRTSTPVIQGMHHRSNLAAVCAWAALYFGPGLYLGYCLADAGHVFKWTIPGVLLLAAMTVLAPMGLMCSATVNAVAGLNLVNVAKGIAGAYREYAYLLLVVVVSSAAFIAVGVYVGDIAGAELEVNWIFGVLLRVVSSLCYMFPPVILTRALGLLLQYHQRKFPFAFDFLSEHKGGAIPQAIALVGCIAIFQPLLAKAEIYAHQGGKANAASDHLVMIYDQYLRGSNNRKVDVCTTEDLEKKVGGNDLVCPARPEVKSMYVVVPNKGYRKETKSFIWIYEREPTGPDRKRVNALLYTGRVINVSQKKLRKLLDLMERYNNAMREEKEKILGEYQRSLIF